ncbi:MAG: sodium:solute symporter family protein [Gemmatimonadota bacterium]|nr:sodium:solute symporter family protein [Gemmatimonadota bacterium]
MIDLGLDLVFWCILYVVLLVAVGTMARAARRDESLRDSVLAGGSLGFGVLVFTFVATQYSGNSVSGIPPQVYLEGLSYVMGVTFSVGVVAGFVLFVPKLRRLAQKNQYVTPADFLSDRFGSPALRVVSSVIFILTLVNFLLAQLTALGYAFQEFTQGQIPYWAAVVVGAVVVVAYVVVGGMRAVAWTDVVQGLVLGLGLLCLLAMLWIEVGSPLAVARSVQRLRPELVANPTLTVCFVWLSNFLLLALGAPLYPQVVQRVFAARSTKVLRNSLAIMAGVPLFIVTIVTFVGAAGIVLFPSLNAEQANQITFRILTHLVESNAMAHYPSLLVMLAVVAAIMSTADACLLSLSSILVHDVVDQSGKAPGWFAAHPAKAVGVVSAVAMLLVTLLALQPWMTLWGLLIIKFEILIQLSPAFVLGTLHHRDDPAGVDAEDILTGMLFGLLTTFAFYVSPLEHLGGVHFGVIGVLVNYAVVLLRRGHRVRNAMVSITGSWKTAP